MMIDRKFHRLFLASAAASMFASAAEAQSCPPAPYSPEALANRTIEAHGGYAAWNALTTFHVDRVHQGVTYGDPNRPFTFDITAEYSTHRIYQSWTYPEVNLAWDGERAWSEPWGGRGRPPRAIMSTGFYVVNIPWLTQDPHAQIGAVGCRVGIAPGVHEDQQFWTLELKYEADVVRKPIDYVGPRDHWLLLIDPSSERVAGIEFYRTWGGEMDAQGYSDEVNAHYTMFVPTTYIEAAGLLWPQQFANYDRNGVMTAHGEFRDYAFNVAFDDSRMTPSESAVMDVSIHLRAHEQSASRVEED